MKKVLSIIVVILMFFCFFGCENLTNINNESEEKNIIDTFEVDKQTIIKIFEETGRYIETIYMSLEIVKKNTCGTIRLNPEIMKI